MNADLTPALVAAGSGSVLLASIWATEHRRDAAMRASRVRVGLRFPVGLTPAAALAALDSLAGLAEANELVAEVAARAGSIQHALWIPESARPAASAAIRGAIPSLRMSEADGPTGRATLSLRIFVPTPVVLQAGDGAGATGALLAGLANLGADEQVVIRWAIRPGAARRRGEAEQPDRATREAETAWRRKAGLSGVYVAGLVLVRAASIARARRLLDGVASVIRSRRGAVGYLRLTTEGGSRSLAAMPQIRRSSGWLSSPELLPLLGWPVGADVAPGVELGSSRELPVPRSISREGRPLFTGRDGAGDRPASLSLAGSLHHVAVVGPSGVGKSVLLTRGILSDIRSGAGGVVIDPKADLLDGILRRVRPQDAGRMVVLDPGDVRPTPGVALLQGGDADARTDVLVGALRATSDTWGIRSDLYGRLALRTLGELPEATLADMGRLFMDEPYRRVAVARLRDPFLLASWQAFEALSPAARAEHVQAPLARVMALLSRPKVREILSSPDPRLDVPRLLAERKWLLVSLAPGALGEAGARLVGAALMYVIWSAIEARVALAPEQRRPLFIYLDELATLTGGLPFGFELLAGRARGLGAGVTVATQTLARIPRPTRAALLGNVATLVSFRAGAEEAPRLARELPGLSATDLMGLARFEVAARIGTGAGSSVTVVTGRAEPLPPATGTSDAIRDRSARAYGSRTTHPLTEGERGAVDEEPPVGQKRRRA